jgi:hypothetical protein
MKKELKIKKITLRDLDEPVMRKLLGGYAYTVLGCRVTDDGKCTVLPPPPTAGDTC